VDKKKRSTLVPKNKKQVVLGQRVALSKPDCMKLNEMYGCFDISDFHKEMYESFCAAMGM
jgi:hypothetical protein